MTLQTLLDRFDLLMDTPESVPKLRRFILRLAIRGRLSERDTSDTASDVLFDEIQQEKQRLYEEDKISRPGSFEEPSREQLLFNVSDYWTPIRLGQVIELISGRHVKSDNYSENKEDGEFPYLTGPSDFGELNPEISKWTDESHAFADTGDVLITVKGSGVGSINMLHLDRVVISRQLKALRPIIVPSGYIYIVLRSLQDHFRSESDGTTVPGLNNSDINDLPIGLPPLEEQRRIVKTVDGLMDECDALEEQQEREHALQVQVGTAATEALQSADDAEELRPAWERVRGHFDTVTATPKGVDALRQTILQLAVQGRFTERNTEDKPASELVRKSSVEIQELYDSGKITKPSERPPVREEEKVFNLPDKWTWTRLGNVLALVNGRAYKKSELLDEGTPVIRIQNLTGGGSWYYTDLDLPPEKYCNTGDLLYTWSGTFGPHIWDGGKAVFHYHIWRIELTTGLTKQFAYHLLQAISADVEEDAHGIMLPHMTKGGMEKHPVPLPPLAEQKRIVETLDRLLPLFDRLNENVNQKSKRGEQLLEAVLNNVAEDIPDQMPAQVAS